MKFERSRPLTASLHAEALETRHVREMFAMANGVDSITLGMYGLEGLRPSLIPVMRVKHLHHRSYEIKDGKLVWNRLPPLMIIPYLDEKGRFIEGNKAAIEFPSFIPTTIAEQMRLYLNGLPEPVTLETKLAPVYNKDNITYIVKKYFKRMNVYLYWA